MKDIVQEIREQLAGPWRDIIQEFRARTPGHRFSSRVLPARVDINTAPPSQPLGPSAELFMYDSIGGGLFSDGITSTAVVAALGELQAAGVRTVNVRVNSPGGDVFEGNAIYNALARFKTQTGAKLVGYNDALAASAASYIILACDEIVTAPNAMWMVHSPWTMALGNAEELRAVAAVLDKLQADYSRTYATATGASPSVVAGWMAGESWFTASEALALGLTDRIASPGQDVGAPSGPMPVSSAKSSPGQEVTAQELKVSMRSMYHRLGTSGAAAYKVAQMAAAIRRTETQHLTRQMEATLAKSGRTLGTRGS